MRDENFIKSVIDGLIPLNKIIEKSRHGFYKNNSLNRKLNRVGVEFGAPKNLIVPDFKEGSTKEDFNFFRKCLSKLPDNLKLFITDYSSEQYIKKGCKCYLNKNNKSGFVITSDKDIISVFSLPGEKMGGFALFNAVKNGGRTLDCVGDKLKGVYEGFGFKLYSTEKWNDDYAPSNWDYEKYGRPNIYFMKFKR